MTTTTLESTMEDARDMYWEDLSCEIQAGRVVSDDEIHECATRHAEGVHQSFLSIMSEADAMREAEDTLERVISTLRRDTP